MKYGLWLLAACLLCTAASASVKLAPEGIEIDGGEAALPVPEVYAAGRQKRIARGEALR